MSAEKFDATVLDNLFRTIEGRKGGDVTQSHTAQLFQKGTAKIAQKLGEEAVEAVIEAMRGDKAALVAESSDLLYHLLVLWADREIDPSEVWAKLKEREGISGIAEKAARREAKSGGK